MFVTPGLVVRSLTTILDPKCNNFSLLRLVAAMAVVVSHAVFLRTGNKADEIFSSTSVYTLGDHAVNVFFVLSGLMVAASLTRTNDIPKFTIARALRIFPALIGCTVLLIGLGAALSECSLWQYVSDKRVVKYALTTLSLSSASAELPGVFYGNPHPSIVNGSLWTLKFEVLCYIILGLLGCLGLLQRQRFSLLVMATWLLAGAFLMQRDGGLLTSLDQAARFWLSFSFGVLLFVFRDAVRISAGLAVGLCLVEWTVLGTAWERVIAPVATGYAAVWLGSLPLTRLRAFTNRTDLSYGVYIFGWPISQTLVYFYPQIGVATLVTGSALLAAGMASLSWRFVEKPCMDLRTTVEEWTAIALSTDSRRRALAAVRAGQRRWRRRKNDAGPAVSDRPGL